MSTETDWYLYREQQRWGPYSWQEMVEMAQHGNVKPNDQLWHPQYPNFVIANQVQGLFQSSKPISPATSVCHQCGKDDKIQKVRAVYSSGFSTTINNSPLVAYGVEQRTITTITPLAQRLTPPAKPILTGWAATSPMAILIVSVVLSLILFCTLFPSLAWESSGANGWANCIVPILVFIVMMAISIPLGIYSVKKTKGITATDRYVGKSHTKMERDLLLLA